MPVNLPIKIFEKIEWGRKDTCASTREVGPDEGGGAGKGATRSVPQGFSESKLKPNNEWFSSNLNTQQYG